MRAINRFNSPLSACVALGVAVAFSCRPVSAQTYDISTDFDTNSNPSTINGGTFSYGFETSLGTGFTLFTLQGGSTPTIKGWTGSGGFPLVEKNTSNSPQSFADFTLQPGQMVLHPSSNGSYAIVRFTTPTSGNYSLNTLFTALSTGGTDVHVLRNNLAIFDSSVLSTGATQSYNPASLSLPAGSTLDFAVGFGQDGSFISDSTAVAGTITKINQAPSTPEPGSLALLMVSGLTGAGLLRRRRRK